MAIILSITILVKIYTSMRSLCTLNYQTITLHRQVGFLSGNLCTELLKQTRQCALDIPRRLNNVSLSLYVYISQRFWQELCGFILKSRVNYTAITSVLFRWQTLYTVFSRQGIILPVIQRVCIYPFVSTGLRSQYLSNLLSVDVSVLCLKFVL